jgi:hypothetical protein
MSVVKSKAELQNLLKSSSACGLFGYGGKHPQDEKAFESQGSSVAPSSVELIDGVLWIHSFKGLLGGMVLPGDSGGSFACKNKKNEWIHLGQISAVSYNYESLIAPAHLSRTFLKLNEPKTESLKQYETKKQAFKVKVSFLVESADHLNKKGRIDLDLVQIIKRKLAQISKINLTQKNISENRDKLSSIKIKLNLLYRNQFKIDEKYFVKNFTNIKTTQSTVLSQNGKAEISEYDFERLSHYSVFNVGDNPSNQFTIDSIDLENGTAFGLLKVQGTTQHYGCIAMILCRKKIISNVSVRLEDLRL